MEGDGICGVAIFCGTEPRESLQDATIAHFVIERINDLRRFARNEGGGRPRKSASHRAAAHQFLQNWLSNGRFDRRQPLCRKTQRAENSHRR
jgi:hypothetical protein